MERRVSAHHLPRFADNRGSHTNGRHSYQREYGRLSSEYNDHEFYASRLTRVTNTPPVDIHDIPLNLPIIAGGAEISAA